MSCMGRIQKDSILRIVLHIMEIKGIPFNSNVEAYDKVISWGHFPHNLEIIGIFSTKHWGTGYQIHKANNSKVKDVENLQRLKAWSISKKKIFQTGARHTTKGKKAFSHFTTSNKSFF